MKLYLHDLLLELLLDLEHVEQHPKYHPEGNALYHSLQVFQLGLKRSNDPQIWAAALFHDIGKAIDGPTHAQLGADLLGGIFNPRVCWLVQHHLDLLTHPSAIKRQYHNTEKLSQLTLLRDLDLDGRDPYAVVCEPENALDLVMQHYQCIKA